MVVQGPLLFILVQFKEHTMRCQQNIGLTVQLRILELYETCIPEHFYKNKEQLKEAIIFYKRPLSQVFATGLHFKKLTFNLFISRTKTMLNITIQHAQMRKFQNFSGKKVKLSSLVFLGVSWI